MSEINEFFISITRDKIFKKENGDFLSHVQQCLKLNKEEDWNYILASEDLLEDTIEAISNFLRFGVSGPTKYDSVGEKYLRLYGVLNASYLQQQTIINLYKFFQCPDIKEKKNLIDTLGIVSLRHKLAAHSANYDNPESRKIQVFVPVRIQLEDFICSYSNYLNDDHQTVNLKAAIQSHLELMCSIYIEVVRKTISTIYKTSKSKKNQLLDSLVPFERMLSGYGLIKIQQTGEFIIKEFTTKE